MLRHVWPLRSETKAPDSRRKFAREREKRSPFQSPLGSSPSTSRLQRESFSTSFEHDRNSPRHIRLSPWNDLRIVSQRLHWPLAGRSLGREAEVQMSELRAPDYGEREHSDCELAHAAWTLQR